MSINMKKQKWKGIYDSIININKKTIYNKKKNEFTCPICKSHNITIKPGMFLDLYMCNECKFKSRNITIENE